MQGLPAAPLGEPSQGPSHSLLSQGLHLIHPWHPPELCWAELESALHQREQPWAGHAAPPRLWERDLGFFSPSWGSGCAEQSCSSASIPAPPARPAPRSPRLSPSAAAAFALIYISTQLQSRAPSPAGEGGGQDRDGKITRGEGEGIPQLRQLHFWERSGVCTPILLRLSIRQAWDPSHPTVGKPRDTGDPSAGSPPNLSAPTARGWGLQPTGNTHSSASC